MPDVGSVVKEKRKRSGPKLLDEPDRPQIALAQQGTKWLEQQRNQAESGESPLAISNCGKVRIGLNILSMIDRQEAPKPGGNQNCPDRD